LRNGFDNQSISNIATDDPAVTEAGGGAGEGGTTETTAAQPPARPKGEVVVRVANAAGVDGAAGEWTTTIGDAGYQTVEATNFPTIREATAVLYAAGFEREAAVLAQDLRAPADGLVALTEPPQVDPAGANLVVLLGTDLASG
jgi:hypothetical protein